MEPDILFSATDRIPGAPVWSLHIRASDRLVLTLPFSIIARLQHDANEAANPEGRPVTVKWHPYAALKDHKFVLFRRTENGLERVDLEDSRPGNAELEITVNQQNFASLAPGESVEISASLPYAYYKPLKAGEKYALLWPGGEMPWWDWGSLANHQNRKIAAAATTQNIRPSIILPASNIIEFTATKEGTEWPERARWEAISAELANTKELRWRQEQERLKKRPPPALVQDSDRDPNAPYLSLALSGPPNLSLSGEYRVEITIHHHVNEKANPDNKPITFSQTYLSDFLSGRYILLRQRPQGPEWIREESGCTLVNEPDEISVGQNSRFISLAPGECHTTTSRIWPDTEFVENLEVGANYSYQFIGNEIAWWDWGTKENHGNTRIGIYETSHKIRPRIVLPASNPVDFTIIE